jgi:hypothetical protein
MNLKSQNKKDISIWNFNNYFIMVLIIVVETIILKINSICTKSSTEHNRNLIYN